MNQISKQPGLPSGSETGFAASPSFIENALELGIIEPRSLESDGGDDDQGRADYSRGFRPSSFGLELKSILGKLTKTEGSESRAQRIVVSGATLEADTSPIAAGLAGICAGSGYRVLLVDCNLGRPTLHSRFQLSNDLGLSNLLAGADAPHLFPQSTSMPRLAVIPAGAKLPNFGSLILRERVFHRLQPIAGHFDYIILDGATLNAASLARISLDADNVLLGVKEQVARLEDVASVTRALDSEGAPEPYVVLIR